MCVEALPYTAQGCVVSLKTALCGDQCSLVQDVHTQRSTRRGHNVVGRITATRSTLLPNLVKSGFLGLGARLLVSHALNLMKRDDH